MRPFHSCFILFLGNMLFSSLIVDILWGCPTTHAFNVGGLVDTTSGPVQGKASALRHEVSEYLGIPYAKPPVGDLRFAAPVAVNRSTTPLDATAYSPDCPCNRVPVNQAPLAGPVGEKITIALSQQGNQLDERCLTVNIWTKPQVGEQKKAVLFWIHGGRTCHIISISPNLRKARALADWMQAFRLVVQQAQYMTGLY
jgi:hypothetical protein